MVKPTATNRVEFIEECQGGKFDGVVAAFRTFASTELTGSVDKELLQALPKSLLFLSHCGMHLWTLLLQSFVLERNYASIS